MKNIYGFVLSVAIATHFAFAETPQLKEIGASDVYVPLGFDDNDNVEVVIEGMFPNTSFKQGPVRVEFDQANKKIKLIPHAYVSSAGFQVMVPYETVVSLGVLKAGEYSIEVGKTNLVPPKLVIDSVDPEKKQTGPDNFLYAPVKTIQKSSERPLKLELKGTFTNSCMSLDRVEIMPSFHQVVAILPIAKYTEGQACTQILKPFKVDVEIHEKLKGRYLFHVRSLNGASVNLIEDIY